MTRLQRTAPSTTTPLGAGRWADSGTRLRLGVAVVALAVAYFAACAAPGVAAAEPRSYTLDAHDSEVLVQVHRRGWLGLFSDSHLLLAEGIAGRVRLDPEDLGPSALQMSLPVASLQVDPPEQRAALGLDDDMDDDDRAEFRDAMLSPDMLDGEVYPRVIVTLETVSGTLPDLLLGVRVRIRQVEQVLRVPVHVRVHESVLTATGEVDLLQSQFGIEPPSSALGMISVEDRLTVRFRVVARADTP